MYSVMYQIWTEFKNARSKAKIIYHDHKHRLPQNQCPLGWKLCQLRYGYIEVLDFIQIGNSQQEIGYLQQKMSIY